MLFSIVVPIYNVEPYIHRCIKSLLEQTYDDIEIILVDDQSPDNCPAICDQYAAADKRIKVIHKINGGLSDARNAGIRAATGDYIIFLDADDYIDTDACERLSKYAAKNADVIIADAIVEGGICNLSHISPDIDRVYTGKEYLKEALKNRKAPMVAWLSICKREFLIKNDLFFKYGILHEDEQFTPRLLLKASSVICSGEPFYHYVIRGDSIMTKKDQRKNARDLYDTCLELEQIYMKLEDAELRDYLMNTLASRMLSIFQKGKLYQYGKEYIHKDLVKRTAKSKKNKYKVALYCLSPRLYYFINFMTKIIGRL